MLLRIVALYDEIEPKSFIIAFDSSFQWPTTSSVNYLFIFLIIGLLRVRLTSTTSGDLS